MVRVGGPSPQLVRWAWLQGGIVDPPTGKEVDKIEFTYDADKDVSTMMFYDGVELLFTLTFTYNAAKDVTSITRS